MNNPIETYENFKTLYSKSKTGKIMIWKIKVDKYDDYSNIVTEYGMKDGKMTKAIRKISTGKNIGKKNETDHFNQAISEAKYKFDKKIHQEYSDKLKSDDTNHRPLPMLALNFQKMKKQIQFPCSIQPKLDGVRCLYNVKQDFFYTRTGHDYNSKTLEQIRNCLKKTLPEKVNVVLDGELYSHTLGFQEISGIIRKQKITQKDQEKIKQIEYIVYDYIPLDDLNAPFKQRINRLENDILPKTKNTDACFVIETAIVNTEKEIETYHIKYVEKGYEGIVVRNLSGDYEIAKRSKHLQKFKNFDDEEFEITGYKFGNGVERDLVIWKAIANTPDGLKEFFVRPTGDHESRKKLLKNAEKYIGKQLTVKFFGYTDDGLPRFPVGVRIRDII